jgi:hypothetical protein
MIWPFLGLLVHTMTSAPKNQYDSPDFEFSYAVYIWSNVFSWAKDNSCPQEFQVRGSSQDSMASLWSAYGQLGAIRIHARSIDKWSAPGLEEAMAPLISMVPSAFLWFRSPRTMAGREMISNMLVIFLSYTRTLLLFDVVWCRTRSYHLSKSAELSRNCAVLTRAL